MAKKSWTEMQDDYYRVPEGVDPHRDDEYYCDGFEAPSPEEIDALAKKNPHDTLVQFGGTIQRIAPGVLVKHGSDVKLSEAMSAKFVADNTKNVPVPKVLGFYKYGPYPRHIAEIKAPYIGYLFMEEAPGENLYEAWPKLNADAKASIAAQLRDYLDQIRSIPSPGYIGSVLKGPLNCFLLHQYRGDDTGPFETEAEFNKALVDAYCSGKPRAHARSFLSLALNNKKHRFVFTHGDFWPLNIMVDGDKVTGIIDWENAGWYPEHWEFCRSWFSWRFQTDWTDYQLTVLDHYFDEMGRLSHVYNFLHF